MNHWKAAAAAAAGLLLLTGCGAKPTDSAAFEKQAKEDVRKFIPALNTGGVETILAQYAPDAEVLAPANPRAIGHDAIRALVTKLSSELQAGNVVDSGNYLAVMQRQPDGRFLMIRDTWNSDRPPPAPAPAPAG